MSYQEDRDALFNNLRVHAKQFFAHVVRAHDFDHDNPAFFRKWRDYMIEYAVACNARSPNPVSEEEADQMGEQCGMWFWNNYRPKEFYEAKAKEEGVRFGRPVNQVIESLLRYDDPD